MSDPLRLGRIQVCGEITVCEMCVSWGFCKMEIGSVLFGPVNRFEGKEECGEIIVCEWRREEALIAEM